MSVDRLVSYFPLCGRWVSVGSLRTAKVFPVFALVVSVGPVAAIGHGSSFSLLARGSL